MANFTGHTTPTTIMAIGTSNLVRAVNVLSPTPMAVFGTLGTTLTYLYRGRLAGNYVYSTSGPPGGGATDISIIAIY